jgi:hypothetical protein
MQYYTQKVNMLQNYTKKIILMINHEILPMNNISQERANDYFCTLS